MSKQQRIHVLLSRLLCESHMAAYYASMRQLALTIVPLISGRCG